MAEEPGLTQLRIWYQAVEIYWFQERSYAARNTPYISCIYYFVIMLPENPIVTT